MIRQQRQLASVRSVHQAALDLTLACTQFVGPMPMAVSLPTAPSLGERVPPSMQRKIEALGAREVKRT